MIDSRLLAPALLLVAMPALSLPSMAQTAADRGAFIIMHTGDTVGIERFTRARDSLAVDVTIKMRGRIVVVARTAADFTISRMTINYYGPNVPADAPPAQTALLTLEGDTVIAEIGSGAQKQTQRIKTTAGAVMQPPSSYTALEQLTMKLRAQGRATQPLIVPIFVTAGGLTLNATVTAVGADSAVVDAATQEFRLRIDPTGRILGGGSPAAGVTITRVDEAAAARLTLGKPDYSAPPGAPYTAEDVSLRGPAGATLAGTLTMPRGAKGRLPAVVTITGSGQQDRDEYIPVAGGYRLFRQIADTLSRRGIAVLRLDDRGIGGSTGDPAMATSADFADDIRAAVAYLRSRPDIDPARIALIGHSEGGIIAPMVAATDPKIRAIALLAGPADKGAEIIRYQQRYFVDHDTTFTAAQRDSVYRTAQVQLDSLATRNPWIRYFLSYAPDTTARKVKAPVLILQGATDRQVPAEQAEKLAAAIRAGGNRDVTVHVFPDHNHLFLADPSGNPQGYAQLTSNKIDSEVLGTIADWLVAKLGAAR